MLFKKITTFFKNYFKPKFTTLCVYPSEQHFDGGGVRSLSAVEGWEGAGARPKLAALQS